MFCVSNNGQSFRAVEKDYTAQADEVLFDVMDMTEITEDMLIAAFPRYGATKNAEKIQQLTDQFQADDKQLLQDWLAAYASGYIDSANEIAQEREQLLTDYLANVKALQGGN